MSGAEPSRIIELSSQECLDLLEEEGVGRVAFTDSSGPAVVPVNYILEDDTVVFRTASGNWLDKALTTSIVGADVRIAFQADHIDPGTRTGWSVLIRGAAHHFTPDESANPPVTPWAGGDRRSYIRLLPREITGVRLER